MTADAEENGKINPYTKNSTYLRYICKLPIGFNKCT